MGYIIDCRPEIKVLRLDREFVDLECYSKDVIVVGSCVDT